MNTYTKTVEAAKIVQVEKIATADGISYKITFEDGTNKKQDAAVKNMEDLIGQVMIVANSGTTFMRATDFDVDYVEEETDASDDIVTDIADTDTAVSGTATDTADTDTASDSDADTADAE